MGFYLRDALNFGPFRINLSRSGVGVSVGVTGLRIGTGPRGAYIHAGRDGLYYRAPLGGHVRRHDDHAARSVTDEMVPVSMPSAAAMSHSDEPEMVQALNIRHAIRGIRSKLVGGTALLSLLAIQQLGAIALVGLLATPLLWIVGNRIDRRRRTVTWSYAADVVTNEHYAALVIAFDALATTKRCRQIVAGRAVTEGYDAKRNAGATHLTDTRPAALARRDPTMLRCNLVPPAIDLKGASLYFMPDMMLIADRTGYAAVPYEAIRSRSELMNFVEHGRVPSDSEVVSYSWAHPNKDGGPDRRFAGNRRLPVCTSGILHIARPSMFDVALKLSSVDHLLAFVSALRGMASLAEPANELTKLIDDDERLSTFDKMVAAAARQAAVAKQDALSPPPEDDKGEHPS